MLLEITFPAATSADANLFARELRGELANCGVPANAISVRRTNPENMDLGGALELSRHAAEAIATLHGGYIIGHVIHNFCRRHRSTVRIKSSFAQIDVATDAADPARLSEILRKIAEMHSKRPKR
jgi:hypothetical protein